jgi:hypothetical protein
MTWDEALWYFDWLRDQRAKEAKELRDAQRRRGR